MPRPCWDNIWTTLAVSFCCTHPAVTDLVVPTEKRSTHIKLCIKPGRGVPLFPLDQPPAAWASCGDAYEYNWLSPQSDEALSGLSGLDRLRLARSMGYCPQLRCQLDSVGNAPASSPCPPGLCYSKLQNGTPTFGACCYTNGGFNSGGLIGYHDKQRPMQKPIYKTNRVVLGADPNDESRETFINANEVYPGVLVTQCPLLGWPYDNSPVETLSDWKQMMAEHDVSIVVQLHPYLATGVPSTAGRDAKQLTPAPACVGRPEAFCKAKCVDWVGQVFSNASNPLAAGVTDLTSTLVAEGGYVLHRYRLHGRPVAHYWYLNWHDFEVPRQQDVPSVKHIAGEVVSVLRGGGGKALVVCYSGRGRSGTLIALALGLMHGFTTNGQLVEAIVRMRESRDSMLETPQQLHFVRTALGLPGDAPGTPSTSTGGADKQFVEATPSTLLRGPRQSECPHGWLLLVVGFAGGLAVAAGVAVLWQQLAQHRKAD